MAAAPAQPAAGSALQRPPSPLRRRRLWVVAAVSAGVYLVALGAVWVPEWAHWHVSPQSLSAGPLQALNQEPSLPVLQEVAAMSLRGVVVPAEEMVATADTALGGQLKLPSFDAQPIELPFAGADLQRGSALWQLMFATLASADVLLDGYLASGQARHYDMARLILLRFAQFEQSQWLDQGLMWNDHAVSARVPVLVKFWAALRQRGEPDPAAEQAVLGLAARSALFLAKPSAYAWRTSHGIISNLALLQIAAAFPALPEADLARQVGSARFTSHLEYWVNREGVTLLHSAGYHVGSLYHLSLGLRLFSLNGLPIPPDWWQRYEQALQFTALLLRPDNTLPMFGDTMSLPVARAPMLTLQAPGGMALPLAPRALQRQRDATSYPVAGHLVWWDKPADSAADSNDAGQTVATWAFHSGLGHKLADDMSVLLWSHGRSWVTNTGYWPYDAPGREQAEGWSAANAPHGLHEGPRTPRRSVLLAEGEAPGLRFADLQRTGSDGLVMRRQIVRLADAQAWVVLDQAQDAGARAWATQWTFDAALKLESSTVAAQNAQGSTFDLTATGGGPQLRVSTAASGSATVQPLLASQQPWGGWVVVGRQPVPAQALLMRQAAGTAWLLSTFSVLGSAVAQTQTTRMAHWAGPEDWAAMVPTAQGLVRLERKGQAITQTPLEGGSTALALRAVTTSAVDSAAIRNAFDGAAGTYRRFPEVVYYRERVTKALLALMPLHEGALAVLGWLSARWALRLRLLGLATWLCGSAWLALVYFAPR